MLTHEDFKRLKEGEWLNCKVCVNICSYDTLHMHVHMDVCIHIFMMTYDNLNVYLCMYVATRSLLLSCVSRLSQGI